MPYINNNPRATPDEIGIGELLDNKAQAGELSGTIRVEGAAEIPGARSGDYRFIHPDGSETSADLMQPQTRRIRSIAQNIIEKSGQAAIVVVELGMGESSQIEVDAAASMAENVISTPDHSINRVIVIKDGEIIVDVSR
jgi:Contact-dependent growth inhibition CdiA C-terminal domain